MSTGLILRGNQAVLLLPSLNARLPSPPNGSIRVFRPAVVLEFALWLRAFLAAEVVLDAAVEAAEAAFSSVVEATAVVLLADAGEPFFLLLCAGLPACPLPPLLLLLLGGGLERDESPKDCRRRLEPLVHCVLEWWDTPLLLPLLAGVKKPLGKGGRRCPSESRRCICEVHEELEVSMARCIAEVM